MRIDPKPSDLQIEVREYLETKSIRRRLFPRAVLVGIGGGAMAVLFRIGLELVDRARTDLVNQLPANEWLRFSVVVAIAALGTGMGMAVGRIDPDSGGSGIPHMKAVLEGHATMRWARLIWVKFAGALAAIGSGLALGREGPTVQIGGAVGMGIAELTGATNREKRALIAAGTGAGLASAFNAPLAGVTFVLEELQRDFQPVVFAAALLCASIATVISRMASGQFPVFTLPSIPAPSLIYLPIFAVLGCVCGLVGVAVNRSILGCSQAVGEWKSKHPGFVALGMGLLIGGAWLISPLLLGGGHAMSETAIKGGVALGSALIFLLIRTSLLATSYSTGVPGGIFAPLLSFGALAGIIVFQLTALLFAVPGLSLAACGVAGMCAMFSGMVRAPLTAIILIGEMTGSYDLLLPLLISSFAAYAVAEGMHDTPIYEALLQRDALKKGWELEDSEPLTAELEIRAGTRYEGRSLRELSMPNGSLVVLCRAGGREFVPDADTVLQEGTRIVVAANSADVLRGIERTVRQAR